MMTAAGVRIMTELLTAELRAGRIWIDGDRVYRGQQEVEPRLSFVRADDPPVTLTPLLDPPAGHKGLQESGENAEEVAVAYPQFAALPKNRLLPTDQAVQDSRQTSAELPRQRKAALARLGWPRNTAPLPQPVLVKKDPKR